MENALLCECGSAKFCLLKNGMIECAKCQKHLNGGKARWENLAGVETCDTNGDMLYFRRKPDLYERSHVDASDGKRYVLSMNLEVI